MTPTEQAARWLADVPTYSEIHDAADDPVIFKSDALAAIARALEAPDAGVVAELVEALRIAGPIALADFANHPFVLNEDEKRKVAVISAALAKLGVR